MPGACPLPCVGPATYRVPNGKQRPIRIWSAVSDGQASPRCAPTPGRFGSSGAKSSRFPSTIRGDPRANWAAALIQVQHRAGAGRTSKSVYICAHKREEQPRFALLRGSARICARRFEASDRNLGRTAAVSVEKRTQKKFAALGPNQANARKEQNTKRITSISLFASGLAGRGSFRTAERGESCRGPRGDCVSLRVVLCGIWSGPAAARGAGG